MAYNNEHNQKSICDNSGIEKILKAMQPHQNNTNVQEAGYGVLDNIGWSDTALQKRIKDTGAVRVVEAATAAHFLGATTACVKYAQHLLENLKAV